MSKKPVMLMILDGWGYREERQRQRRRAREYAKLRPALGRIPACLSANLRPRCRPAGRADGQFRSRPPQHRRRPRGDAGAPPHRHRDRGWLPSQKPGTAKPDRSAQNIRRRLPPARAGLPRRRALASEPGHRTGQNNHRRRHPRQSSMRCSTAATPHRKVPPNTSKISPPALPENARIGTLIGRYYGMDRDKRWERVSQSYNLIVAADGKHFDNAANAIATSYAENITDEFVSSQHYRRLYRRQKRRRPTMLQLPRRPRPRNPNRPARPSLRRFRARAKPQIRCRRRHDRL